MLKAERWLLVPSSLLLYTARMLEEKGTYSDALSNEQNAAAC